MRPTDQMLARISSEIAEKQTFIDGIVEDAEKKGRDLSAQEMEMVTRARDRQGELNEQAKPMQEAARIASESADRIAEIGKLMNGDDGNGRPREMEYRSAGHYMIDKWRAGIGQRDAMERLELYHRAAAHQTTGDLQGLLPERILGPVVNFVDQSRPFISAIGARNLPSGSWSRPRVTQHTDVGVQSQEKGELVSRKLIVSKVPVAAQTFGGYVNVSRQSIDWTDPSAMDLVVSDLAGVYAEETEQAAVAAVDAATTAGPTVPASATGQAVASAIWTAAGTAWSATKGQGRLIILCSPDMLGFVGPLFAPVSPQNAQSTGFQAGSFGSGAMGAISGITVVMSPAADAGTLIVLSSAAVEFYEDRVGALQVVEPSVMGVQVAYAGYAATLVLEPGGVVEITKGA